MPVPSPVKFGAEPVGSPTKTGFNSHSSLLVKFCAAEYVCLLVMTSVPFAVNRSSDLGRIPWDLVVIDEAHRLRNSYRQGHKSGQAMRSALRGIPKLLLTATPLQNDLAGRSRPGADLDRRQVIG